MCLMKNVASCMFDTILYYWYELLIWFLQSVFKQLNNLLLSVTSACPRPGQKAKLTPSPLFCFLWGSQWVVGLLTFEPPYKETCNVSWTNKDEGTPFGPGKTKGPLLYWSSCGWSHKIKCYHTSVKTRKVCRPICNYKCVFFKCEISWWFRFTFWESPLLTFLLKYITF